MVGYVCKQCVPNVVESKKAKQYNEKKETCFNLYLCWFYELIQVEKNVSISKKWREIMRRLVLC